MKQHTLKILLSGAVLLAPLFFLGCTTVKHPTPPPFTLQWQTLPPIPTPIGGHTAANTNDRRTLILGGTTWKNNTKHWLNQTWITSIKTPATWTPGPSLPSPLAYAGHTIYQNHLYLFGGASQSGLITNTSAFKINLNKIEAGFTSAPPLPEPRVYGGCATIDNTIIFTTGSSHTSDWTAASNKTWKLDLSSKNPTWQPCTDLPDHGRVTSAIAAIQNKLYVFGGASVNSDTNKVENTNDLWIYDPVNDTWSEGKPLPAPNRTLAASPYKNRWILLTGGYSDDGFSSEAWAYDTTQDQYHALASMPVPYGTHTMTINQNTIYITGGEDKPRSRTNLSFTATISNP
ncbi:Kelch repeat-containing protein [Poriferisphaera sp. WC338]|uniref:Kelch repeat-containing protein n=1 Tax=Poriferisphaera sp. WC338 TaxID=3425129 RepID=UPI003D818C2A